MHVSFVQCTRVLAPHVFLALLTELRLVQITGSKYEAETIAMSTKRLTMNNLQAVDCVPTNRDDFWNQSTVEIVSRGNYVYG